MDIDDTEGRSGVQREHRSGRRWVGPVVGAVLIAAAVATLVVARANTGAGDDAAGIEPAVDPTPLGSELDAGGITFDDVTETAGLTEVHSTSALTQADSMTSGVAVADYDGDGWLDIYLTRIDAPASLYRNQGDGTFEDVTETAGVPGPTPGQHAAAFADFTGDGHLDLYVTAAQDGTDILYRNQGDGTYLDITEAAGLALERDTTRIGRQHHGASVVDYDGDGHMDLLVTHWDLTAYDIGGVDTEAGDVCAQGEQLRGTRVASTEPNRTRLWRNLGDGTFEDATATAGLQELNESVAFTTQFVDITGNTWPDLLVAGDFCTQQVWYNQGDGTFEPGPRDDELARVENAMGSAVGDITGDGNPDWFLTSVGYPTESGNCPANRGLIGCSGNRLLSIDGDPNSNTATFTDETDAHNLRWGWWGWGVDLADYANDGRTAVTMTNGYRMPTRGTNAGLVDDAFFEAFTTTPVRMWIDSAEGNGWVDIAETVGVADTGVGHALVSADFDRDGRIDLLVANNQDTPRLWRNTTDNTNNWLTISLADPTSNNTWGDGARVEVRAGNEERVGWVTTTGSYETQRPAELHFGMGDVDGPYTAEVTWTGGERNTYTIDSSGRHTLTRNR